MPCKEEFDVNQIRYEEGFFICAGHDAHGSRINRLQVEYDYPKQHITPRLLKFLADSYEFECEGECLATWKFFYEGGGDVGEFKSRQITARDGSHVLVENKYVNYEYDVLLTVVKDGDTFKIDSLQQEKSEYVDGN